jgi:hypothetical protein
VQSALERAGFRTLAFHLGGEGIVAPPAGSHAS